RRRRGRARRREEGLDEVRLLGLVALARPRGERDERGRRGGGERRGLAGGARRLGGARRREGEPLLHARERGREGARERRARQRRARGENALPSVELLERELLPARRELPPLRGAPSEERRALGARSRVAADRHEPRRAERSRRE